MSEEVTLHLFKEISPFQILLLVAIKIYATSLNKEEEDAIPPHVLLHLVKFIERKQDIDNTNQLRLCNDLLSLITAFGESSFTSQLIEEVWKIRTVEDLNTFIKKCNCFVSQDPNQVIANGKLTTRQFSSGSMFGIFITKICTCFDLLEFNECLTLFQGFERLRSSTKLMINKSETQMDLDYLEELDVDERLFNALENNLMRIRGVKKQKRDLKENKEEKKISSTVSASKIDLEALINNQITILESFGTPTPPFLKKVFNMMSNCQENLDGQLDQGSAGSLVDPIPACHYLNYLENLSHSNYNGALDSLHQYFDYMVSNLSKYFYHFALVSKASLHQFFGEDKQAVDTIVEAISVARENKDNVTLTYILSWFYNFVHNKPHLWKEQNLFNKSNEDELLDFLIKKSAAINNNLLLAINQGFQTMQMMSYGMSKSQYMASLTKTLFTAVNDSKSTFVKCCEIASCVWNNVGSFELSEVYNDLSLHYSEKTSDYKSLKCRQLYTKFMRGNINNNVKRNGNGISNAIESSVATENYTNVESLLTEMDELKDGVEDDSLYNSIQIRLLMMQIQMHLSKGRVRQAHEIMTVLSSSELKDLELRKEVFLLDIEVLIHLANYQDAIHKISSLEYADDYMRLRLNILKCRILIMSGDFYSSLSTLIHAMELCKLHGLVPLQIEATLLFIRVLNTLGHHKDARLLLEDIIPLVESYNSHSFKIAAYSELDKCR